MGLANLQKCRTNHKKHCTSRLFLACDVVKNIDTSNRSKGRRELIFSVAQGRQEFFSINVAADPFDSQGDQCRAKVTHMQQAHRSWLVGPLVAWWLAIRLYLSILNYPRDGSFPQGAPALSVSRRTFPYN